MDRRQRGEQLAYSELMAAMLDETKRRQKAAKLLAVLRHALGRDGLDGLVAVDVGCSAGFIADELAAAGASTHGVDIDEPGLARARERFGARVSFHRASGSALPFEDGSVDVVVLNHIYEHVSDPEAVVADIHRVLAPTGVLYLGIGNRLGVVEPHYKLPFLSWLPHGPIADGYVRAFGRADHYYERFRTRRGLRRLFAAYDCWDYTLPVLADAAAFSGHDVVPPAVGRVPVPVLRGLLPLVPTYIWVAFRTPQAPAGPALRVPPRRV
ncbi:MAG TPA: class I SAM-dependent methyltransferase [Dermatophilaceae bacterium]|nr:class I SAM-dependent methyltransferase [Dermatophilaceae bacterium]